VATENTVPILKYVPSWMPGAGFRRHAFKLAHILANEIVKKPYEAARQNLVSNTWLSITSHGCS
jgi:hypothetical protein